MKRLHKITALAALLAAIVGAFIWISDALAANRNDFLIDSISITYPSFLSRFGAGSGPFQAVNRGTYWEIPYSTFLSRGTLKIKWKLKNNLRNTNYGNALMNKVNGNSTVWGKKGSGSSRNFGSATRDGNYKVTKTISMSQIGANPGWPCQFSLGVRYNSSTMVYSDPAWKEARLQSARNALRGVRRGPLTPINPTSGGGTSGNVKFADQLYGIFKHDRCVNCHVYQTIKPNSAHNTLPASTCDGSNCHGSSQIWQYSTQPPQHANRGNRRWIEAVSSPTVNKTATAQQMCNAIKQHSATNTLNEMRHHLLEDPLIKWAIVNGRVRSGANGLQQKPLPGITWQQWETMVNAWLDGGRQCQ